jgi:hypothetical protein
LVASFHKHKGVFTVNAGTMEPLLRCTLHGEQLHLTDETRVRELRRHENEVVVPMLMTNPHQA